MDSPLLSIYNDTDNFKKESSVYLSAAKSKLERIHFQIIGKDVAIFFI